MPDGSNQKIGLLLFLWQRHQKAGRLAVLRDTTRESRVQWRTVVRLHLGKSAVSVREVGEVLIVHACFNLWAQMLI